MSSSKHSRRVWSRREFVRLGIGGVGFAALASACAAQTPSAPAKPAESKPAEAAKPAAPTSAAAAPAAAPAVAKAAPTGKLVIMPGAEPPTLDVLFSTSGSTRAPIFENVVEGLLTVENDMKLRPNLATSWERIDPTRTRFKLQQGVTFHNGEKFTSAAVAASIKRLVDPDFKAQALSYMDTFDRAEPVDDYTVDVVTKVPDPILVRRMTFLGIMPPEFLANTPDDAATKPVGTGPYRFVEWTKGQRLALTANDQYWGPDKPTIKDVEFQPRPEAGVRVTALRAGEAHLVDNVSPEDAGTLPPEQVASGLWTECEFIRVNAKTGYTADVRVRQAVNMAIDRPTIVASLFGQFGELPNGQMFASTSYGYDPNMKDVPYDLARAQQLIKEAGAEGKEFTIVGPSNDRYLKGRETMEAVTAMLNKAGLKAQLRLLEPAEWLKAGYELENPPMEAWFSSAGNELQDPDRIFGAYFVTGGRLSLYSNPEMDQLMQAQRSELDQDKRAQILMQMSKKNQDEAYLLPLVVPYQIFGISPKLKFQIIPSGALPIARMQLIG